MQVFVPVQTTAEIVLVDVTAAQKKAMKKLTCRKCEGHGTYAILKGHAGVCPYKDCSCGTCASVMSMRANALIRRFRHRQPDQSMAVVKALRSKNGNMRLRIVPRNDEETVVENDGTLVTYSSDKNGHQTYTTTTRRSSIMTNSTDDRDSVVSTPPSTTNNSTPSGSPPLLVPYGDVDIAVDPVGAANWEQITNIVRTTMLNQILMNPTNVSPALISFLLQPTQQPSFEPSTMSLAPPVLFPTFLNGLSVPSLSV
ncbi:DM domain-containing protein [Caenorhabditis elegans]|uniref:DM domain-containing protein n=1 Tax=Caenorhabditis elegans TaxID=6239 RepID=Q95XU1_CAEEL|nr:DM domain-containing protein [Caenorhabditis elegans]CCD73137.1 DM domain-containing protein [Caenorhabditis elegans]|eukprot:NP_500305.1 DM (Doublesex/MAB-3) Domain family [Caenorhabditis elegans]